jgi:hypothetical protein
MPTKNEISRDRSDAVVGQTHPDLLKNLTGIFANNPRFEEMVRAAEKERQKEREEALHEEKSDVVTTK